MTQVMDHTAHEPLLESDSADHSKFEDHSHKTCECTLPKQHSKGKILRASFFLLGIGYFCLLFLYVLLFVKYQGCGQRNSWRPSDLFPSLANSNAVKYETRHIDVKIHGNDFVGDPRPELEAAWHELFENIRVAVSQEDLKYYNLTSVALSDGSGYAAELGVHHELHCLKKIRHWIYRDHYLKNETSEELVEWKAHIDHCIEMLRETIICRGDPSLSTFEWISPHSLTAVAKSHHQCVNWESLVGWVRERHVKIFEDGVLKAQSGA